MMDTSALPVSNSIISSPLEITNNNKTPFICTNYALHPYKVVDNKLVILKIGSNSLVKPDGRSLDHDYLNDISRQCDILINKYDMRVVIVSSGACAVGVNYMGLDEKPDVAEEKQALAAIGQIHVIEMWERSLKPFHLRCAQLLLTQRDFEVYRHSRNLTNTLKVLFKWKVVPIVNENDPIATSDITVGDNDRLSSLLAVQLVADSLVLLTDIDGLYDKDPRYHKDAKRIEHIECVTLDMLDVAGGPGKKGRGGMRSKLESARNAAAGGVNVHIANSRVPNVLTKVMLEDDPHVGTHISPLPQSSENVDAVHEEHRRWVQCRAPAGIVRLTKEAEVAFLTDQPLKAECIADMDHCVRKGDAVSIVNVKGFEIARAVLSHGKLSYTESNADPVVQPEDVALLAPKLKKINKIDNKGLAFQKRWNEEAKLFEDNDFKE